MICIEIFGFQIQRAIENRKRGQGKKLPSCDGNEIEEDYMEDDGDEDFFKPQRRPKQVQH